MGNGTAPEVARLGEIRVKGAMPGPADLQPALGPGDRSRLKRRGRTPAPRHEPSALAVGADLPPPSKLVLPQGGFAVLLDSFIRSRN